MREVRNILLLENEEHDVFLFRRALNKLEFTGNVRIVSNGTEAREYLEGRGRYVDRAYYPMPDLIVSDLKMPSQSGLEFLKWLREQSGFREIPFVMFSGSGLPVDQNRATELGALAYFTKSGDFQTSIDRIRAILETVKRQP